MENTLRFLRIYIESLTMSSQEPLKGPKQGGGVNVDHSLSPPQSFYAC